MGFRRYVAPTAREALERIRKELGADAVILSNRRTGANRVEIIAAAQGQMDALVDDFVPAAAPARAAVPATAGRKAATAPAAAPARRTAPESFQEFIRRQSAEPGARTEGVAMYHQIAGASDEPPMPAPRPAAARLAAISTARPAVLPAAARPARSETRDAAEPAVFRRRPSRAVAGPESPEGMADPGGDAISMAVAPAVPQELPAVPPAVEQALAPVVRQMVQKMVEQKVQQLAPRALDQPPAQPAAPPMPPPMPPPPPAEPMFAQGTAVIAPLPDSRLMAELQSLRSALTDRISKLEVRLAQAEPTVAAALAAPIPVALPAAAAPVASAPAVPAAVVAPVPVPAAVPTPAAASTPAVASTPAAAPTPAVARAPAVALAPPVEPSAVRRQVMTRLIMSGFSPQLARRVGEAAPASLDVKETDAWLQQVIVQYVRCPADVDNPLLVPGAIALVGPTGVGKTTTLAKIAARFVVRHGAGALGLVTLDSYRMGAHEQLRGYGRILGVPVHTAHDAASLRELLASLQGRRQVLIDTCGMSQRDPRLGEMLAMLDQARFCDRPVRRVLLINAASHAETLDEVARGWRVESASGAILTKMDEAARIGGALDALMRFQTPLLGLTNGQRVPEDWHPGNPPLLAHIALKPFGAAFALDSDELQSISRSGAAIA